MQMYPWTIFGFEICRRLGITSTMMLLMIWFISTVEMPVCALRILYSTLPSRMVSY